MNADAEYLITTVGPVLSQGIAECLIADPDDPVAFVGQWLKQYVKNTSVTEQVRQEKAKDEANAQKAMAAAATAKSALQAQISHKQAVIAQVWIVFLGPRHAFVIYLYRAVNKPARSVFCDVLFCRRSIMGWCRSLTFLVMHWTFGSKQQSLLWRIPMLHLLMSWW